MAITERVNGAESPELEDPLRDLNKWREITWIAHPHVKERRIPFTKFFSLTATQAYYLMVNAYRGWYVNNCLLESTIFFAASTAAFHSLMIKKPLKYLEFTLGAAERKV